MSLARAPVDFSYLQTSLESDQETREKIREAVRVIEQEESKCFAVLNRVHTVSNADTQGPEQLPPHLCSMLSAIAQKLTPLSTAAPALLAHLTPLLPPLRTALAALASLIPPTQFYRYCESFSRALQTASFIIVLRGFLADGSMVGKEEVQRELGISDEWRESFFFRTEEYLHSLVSLLNELSRLAVNRVTLGDYEAPVEYAKFAKELSSAFSLLNLKNDSLRKRVDSIKYDVKRLEEVVYDISLRGLLQTRSTAVKIEEQEDADEQGRAKRARVEES